MKKYIMILMCLFVFNNVFSQERYYTFRYSTIITRQQEKEWLRLKDIGKNYEEIERYLNLDIVYMEEGNLPEYRIKTEVYKSDNLIFIFDYEIIKTNKAIVKKTRSRRNRVESLEGKETFKEKKINPKELHYMESGYKTSPIKNDNIKEIASFNGAIDFPDMNLENMLREKMGIKYSGIKMEDMKKLDSLNLLDENYNDLSGIQHAENIKELNISPENTETLGELDNQTKMMIMKTIVKNSVATKGVSNEMLMMALQNEAVQQGINLFKDVMFTVYYGIIGIAIIIIVIVIIFLKGERGSRRNKTVKKDKNLLNLKNERLRLAILNYLKVEGKELTKSKALEIKKMELKGKELGYLEGIELFKNLEYLDLESNDVNSLLEISKLKELKFLNLNYNLVEDIRELLLLKNLKELYLYGNEIKEEAKKTIKSLMIRGCRVEYKSEEFKDIHFEKALRKALKKTSGKFSKTDFLGIKELDLSSSEIFDIKGIALFRDLERLKLEHNKISNVSELKKLKNLHDLRINDNQILCLKGMENLKSLKYLDVSRNKLNSLSGLKGAINLEKLYANYNLISDLVGMKTLESLKILSLNENKVSELRPIVLLKNLEELDLYGNEIENLFPLTKLENLNTLVITKNPLNIFANKLIKELKEKPCKIEK